jgi:DNA-directed RNA polymerase subunit RPC12/RpoP
MPLIKCPACEREISDQAAACPHCGHPLVKPEQPGFRTTPNFNIGCLGLVVIVVVGIAIYLLNRASYQPPTVPLPASEEQFCSIINAATSTYNSLSQQRDIARSQRNGIVEDQLTRQMTDVYRKRNTDAFHAAQQINFRFNNWIVSIMRVSSTEEHWSGYLDAAIPFDVHPLCSTISKIRAATAATQTNIGLLSQKRQGDHLVMSGMFLRRFSGPANAASPPLPISADEFEGSFTESGSMDEPEFSVLVTTVDDH